MPLKDREARLAYWREYYLDHLEEKTAYGKMRYAGNREVLLAKAKAYAEANREQVAKYKREYHRLHPEVVRDWDLRKHYGITLVQFENIFAMQHGLCALCGGLMDRTVRGDYALDHDHKTGRIRGIIHGKCNIMLGCAEDSTEILQKAIDYLDMEG